MANLARSVGINQRRLRAGGVTGVKRGPAQAIRWREMSLRIDSEAGIRREGGEEVPKGRLVAAGMLVAQRQHSSFSRKRT